MTVTSTVQPRRRGRPRKPGGALTPAERKQAQRLRDHNTIYGSMVIDTVTTDGLPTAVRHALAEGRTATLTAVLKELGRRGGLVVTARPSAVGPSERVKA